MIIIKSARELEIMCECGRRLALSFKQLEDVLEPEMTTEELNESAASYMDELGVCPAFRGYRGFPKDICVSINAEVVHGIPKRTRKLHEGDIVSIDIGALYGGYYTDCAKTFVVGRALRPEVRELVEVTRTALEKGIEQAKPGNRLTDISHAIQTFVESHGFSVVRDFVSHGIGVNIHEEPQLPNFGLPARGPLLQAGMVFAIEPMVNVGTHLVYIRPDNWTAVTADGSLSAHFEHTVAITQDGPWILTEI